MLKVLSMVVSFVFVGSLVQAADFVLDAPTTVPDQYCLYVDKTSGIVPDGNASVCVPSSGTSIPVENLNLSHGSYFAVVTSVSAEGIESDPSNEISFSVPKLPSNLRLNITITVN